MMTGVFNDKIVACFALLFACMTCHAVETSRESLSPQQIIDQSPESDWRSPDPENVLYLELEKGRVVIELALALEFAPNYVANTKALVREGYYDGLGFYRVADGFVAEAGDPRNQKPIKRAKRRVAAEPFLRGELRSAFTPVDTHDGFAAITGFAGGFAVARNGQRDEAWLVHCPGAFAMGRDDDPDSGGTQFYIVIGHAPRYLDRNVAVFGRVLLGLEYVQQMRRGYEPGGYIKAAADYTPIRRMRVAADVAEKKRTKLEVMRTDSDSFKRIINSRRNRPEKWFTARPDYVDVCGVTVPVRRSAAN